MRALKWLLSWGLVCTLGVFATADGEQFKRQRGIEVHGGLGMYLDMSDPNSFANGFTGGTGYTQTEVSESDGAFSGGFALIYKTKPYFAWHVGVNVMATDSATATAVNVNNETRQCRILTRNVEIFATANFYWNLSSRLNLQVGAGPTFNLASMDKEVPSATTTQYGESFYGAHGRSFGFLSEIGAELFLLESFSLKVGGGYRFAPMDRFKYFRELVGAAGDYKEGQIAYWPDSYDTFTADYSGGYVNVGVRLYFDPATNWNRYGD